MVTWEGSMSLSNDVANISSGSTVIAKLVSGELIIGDLTKDDSLEPVVIRKCVGLIIRKTDEKQIVQTSSQAKFDIRFFPLRPFSSELPDIDISHITIIEPTVPEDVFTIYKRLSTGIHVATQMPVTKGSNKNIM